MAYVVAKRPLNALRLKLQEETLPWGSGGEAWCLEKGSMDWDCGLLGDSHLRLALGQLEFGSTAAETVLAKSQLTSLALQMKRPQDRE